MDDTKPALNGVAVPAALLVPMAAGLLLPEQGATAMPFLRFDLIEGRSESEIRKLLDVTHEVLLEALKALSPVSASIRPSSDANTLPS
jgi:hypothetical protein